MHCKDRMTKNCTGIKYSRADKTKRVRVSADTHTCATFAIKHFKLNQMMKLQRGLEKEEIVTIVHKWQEPRYTG